MHTRVNLKQKKKLGGTLILAFGLVFNAVQSNSIAEAMQGAFQVPKLVTGGAVALHDRDQRVASQHRIGQQFALGGEDGGLGGAESLAGTSFQFLAFGAHRE